LNGELNEKEKEVEKFENHIKQKHIRIAKKQHKVDNLNKKWAELSKNGEDENQGPMEAKKNNIRKQTIELEDEKT